MLGEWVAPGLWGERTAAAAARAPSAAGTVAVRPPAQAEAEDMTSLWLLGTMLAGWTIFHALLIWWQWSGGTGPAVVEQ